MWDLLTFSCVVLVLVLTGHSGHAAISGPSEKKRADAFRVFRVVWRPVVVIIAVGLGMTTGFAAFFPPLLF